MAHLDEGFVPLPAYAARVSGHQKLVVDVVDQTSRSAIVLSGIGPQAVPIHFRADGITIFEFEKSDAYSGGAVDPFTVDDVAGRPKEANQQMARRDAIRERRFRYMNAFQTCFHVSANVSNKLSPPSSQSHHIWARQSCGHWHMQDNGAGLIDPLPFALTIELGKMQDALDEFRKIEGPNLQVALDTLDLFYRAAFNMNHHEYQTVLILGWAIVEGCQDIIWRRFIEGGYKKINRQSEIKGKRKSLLLTDRNFTASIKSQVLALTGEYADFELEGIDKVRKRRNGFMHSLEPVSIGDAFAAMWACGTVSQKALGLNLKPFGNPGGWDYKR
jgi:hypothetical protein